MYSDLTSFLLKHYLNNCKKKIQFLLLYVTHVKRNVLHLNKHAQLTFLYPYLLYKNEIIQAIAV